MALKPRNKHYASQILQERKPGASRDAQGTRGPETVPPSCRRASEMHPGSGQQYFPSPEQGHRSVERDPS